VLKRIPRVGIKIIIDKTLKIEYKILNKIFRKA
jgi:hypothetical protein